MWAVPRNDWNIEVEDALTLTTVLEYNPCMPDTLARHVYMQSVTA